MPTYFCLECGKESKMRNLRKKPIEAFDEDGLICKYIEYSCSCGSNKFAIVKR